MSHKRERENDASCDTQIETPLKRAKLTRRNLAQHTTEAMPPRKKSSGDPSASASRATPTTTTTTTTDGKFANTLERNKVRVADPMAVQPPFDLAEVRLRINAPRSGDLPDLAAFKQYVQWLAYSPTEAYVTYDMFREFRQTPRLPYQGDYNLNWNELQDAGGSVTSKLSPPKPDYADYPYSTRYSFEAQDALGGFLIPSGTRSYAMPHFVAEMKSNVGNMHVGFHQAAYDGAVIVQADQQAYEYAQAKFEYGKTRAISAQFNGNELTLRAHYAVQNDAGEVEYFCHELDVFNPARSFEQYGNAYKSIRNAQDFGRERTEQIFELLRSAPRAKHAMAKPAPTAAEAIATLAKSVEVSTKKASHRDQIVNDNGEGAK